MNDFVVAIHWCKVSSSELFFYRLGQSSYKTPTVCILDMPHDFSWMFPIAEVNMTAWTGYLLFLWFVCCNSTVMHGAYWVCLPEDNGEMVGLSSCFWHLWSNNLWDFKNFCYFGRGLGQYSEVAFEGRSVCRLSIETSRYCTILNRSSEIVLIVLP